MRKMILFSAAFLLLTIACKKDDSKPSGNNQSSNTNSISDIDGNSYKTVTIGAQTWMAENLKVTKYNDGTAIVNVTDNSNWSGLTTGAYCWYNNDEATNKATYGSLYNWYAVNTMKLCPKNWHVPTDAEWTTLETYLAGNGYNYDGTTSTTNVRDKIAKSLSAKSGWNSSTDIGSVGNTDYTAYRNKSGFSGVAGGFRSDNGTFNYVGQYGIWWSASEENPNCSWYRDMTYNNALVDRNYGFKKNGFCVRCLQD